MKTLPLILQCMQRNFSFETQIHVSLFIRKSKRRLTFKKKSQDIYDFAKMNYNDLVIQKLQQKLFKASPNDTSRYKTQRKLGRERILKPWIQDKILLPNELKFIQDVCNNSMVKWNYNHVTSLDQAQNADTVSNLSTE